MKWQKAFRYGAYRDADRQRKWKGIYVDPLAAHGWVLYGKTMPSCHLFCDGDLDKLHAFAKEIGLKREWFQSKNVPHYDLTEGKRKQAIATGAIELSREAAVKLWLETKQVPE